MTNDDLVAITRLRRRLRSGSARAIRTGAGASLGEVAQTVGVNKATISRWESGKRIPSGALAQKYAGVLDDLMNA